MISNRYFCTYLGSDISRERKLNNGLPQGLILAPLLFNLYISDLPETRSKIFRYADDTALAYKSKNLGQAETILTEDLTSLCSYFKEWRLKPSESKTEVRAFHLNNNQTNRELNVQFNGNTRNTLASLSTVLFHIENTLRIPLLK